MTSANLLIVVLVGAAVGAIVGLALGGTLSGFYLAVVAGFLGTIRQCPTPRGMMSMKANVSASS